MLGFQPYETFQLLVESGGVDRTNTLLIASCDSYARRTRPTSAEREQFEALALRLFPAAAPAARFKAAATLGRSAYLTPTLEKLVIDNIGDDLADYLIGSPAISEATLLRLLAGELGVVVWADQQINFVAAHFAEWLDLLADAREEDIDRAAVIPSGLRRLLVQLGFTFDDPIVGRLETGDVPAIESLLGAARTREVKGGVGRLFDSSGKASLVLNLDEFTLALSLRTGIFMFEAEEVFRWLRLFRDENFFGDTVRQAAHADNVRDLRRAAREPPPAFEQRTAGEV